ncbi:peptidoglycan recognition family protein [Streptomyces sp. NPDC046805]|uniref:N-acetylmuramoyl-L-alanine amidase n=1 Tax=Streptomyces sp. NPDC046805 TaxID=3155134 RepID=UPI0033CC586A
MRRPVAPRIRSAVRGHRWMIGVTASAALLLPLLLGPSDDDVAPDERLEHDFTSAADEYHVPHSVLMAVAYQQSRWDSHIGVPSVSGGYGPMHLVDTRAAGIRDDGAQALAGAPAGAPTANGGKAALPPAERPTDLRRAARLIGTPAARLRTDTTANVRGGAALLAATQRQLGKQLSADPADWWETVARFAGAEDNESAATYANDVFTTIRQGATRTTDTGQHITLTASPGVRPHTVMLRDTQRPKQVECPPELTCSWLSSPHVKIDDEAYGNHDLADRPRDQKIEYIVIHDTEATLSSMLQTIQVPTEPSWHYSIRSKDGHVTQHVRTKDEAWHSGSQFVNDRSIGVEHEGFLKQPDAWYSERMYRASARLVRYLAKKYDIPLDRQHIIGHDNVPAPTASTIPGMHEDPGPFWDWRHYFDLLGAPLRATAGADSDMVTVLPDYKTHSPVFTGCVKEGERCATHGSSAVRLHTEPADDAPLIQDPGRHPEGDDSTDGVSDLGSRVSAGQQFAVADRSGDWTAIWFQGEKAWFKNPKNRPTAVGASGRMVTPKEGLDEIPVFGRPLPEESAYPEGIAVQYESPLPYELGEGQRYVTGGSLVGSYTDRSAFDTTPSPVVDGTEEYYEIQLGHRLAYVRASDVDVVNSQGSPVAAAPTKTGRTARP